MDATDAPEWESEFTELETESGQGLTIEEIWKYLPNSYPNEALRREWHEEGIPTILRELRDAVNPMTYIDISVVVPFCDPCCWTDEHKIFPIVFGPDWLDGYKALGPVVGLSRSQIAAVARAIRNGSWLPTCWQCGSSIDLTGEEGFHIRHVSFAEYFCCIESTSSRIRRNIKKLVHQVFGTKCVGCQRKATTLDHIVSFSKGGPTELTNLQPMCNECNKVKADQEVKRVSIHLIFRLLP